MYNQNAEDLEKNFKKVLNEHGLKIFKALDNGHLPCEDGIPWFEVYRNQEISLKEGKNITQEISNEMNIQMIFVSVENSESNGVLKGYMDLDVDAFREKSRNVIPALTNNPKVVDFLESQGFKKIIKPKA